MAVVETLVATGAATRAVPRPTFEALTAALEEERDRWFLWIPVLVGVGIAIYFGLPDEPGLWLALGLVTVALVLFVSLARGTLATVLLGAALAASTGFALAKLRTDRVHAPVIEKPLRFVEVKGFVELVEPRATRGQRLTLRVTSVAGLAADKLPLRVRVRAMNALAGVKPGDALKLKASLSPPSAPALPGGYDFARQAWYQGLGAVGFAMARPEIDAEAGQPPWPLALRASIERLRQAIGARVKAALPGETGAIAEALITGERGGISAATNDIWRDSGLFHVLSISGLHMSIMAGAIFVAVRLLLAAVPAIALNYPIKKWAAVAAAVGALGYLMISGAAFATVRSYIMISIMFAAILMDRPAIALRNVALAALVCLLIWPESLNDVGFQMSFAAVVALTAAYEAIRDRWAARDYWPGPLTRVLYFFGGIVLSTLVAGLAVAPFAAYHFHTSQQFAILANLIAIPVCNLVVMPAALATLVALPFGLEAVPLAIMGWGIDAMSATAAWVAALPGAVGHIAAIPVASFGLMVAGGLWLLLLRSRPRYAGLTAIAGGLALAPTLPRPDVLIGRDGQLVAIRGTDGRLTALSVPQAGFEMKRWLEHDGDARTAKEAMSQAGFRCDVDGCTTRTAGTTVAVLRHPAALADDCAKADVLAASLPVRGACSRPRVVIDLYAVRDNGTHALYITPVNGSAAPPGSGTLSATYRSAGVSDVAAAPAIRVETVAGKRGVRPWVRKPFVPDETRLSDAAARRLAGFAAPALTAGRSRDRGADESELDEPDLDPGELPNEGGADD
jgi:competence protein ComEC